MAISAYLFAAFNPVAQASEALSQGDPLPISLSQSERSIQSRVEARKNLAIATLEQWVNINTGSWNVDGKRELAPLLVRELELLGFQVDVREVAAPRWPEKTQMPLGPLIVAKRPARTALIYRPRRFLLVGHYDTVFEPSSDFRRMILKDEHRNIVRGPGVADMKGGIVVMLEALRALKAEGLIDAADWTVILNPDEEISSPASGETIRAYARGSDYGFVYEMAHNQGAMVEARRGLGKYFMSIRGVPAHMGSASKGASAILESAHKIIKSEALTNPLRGLSVRTGIIRGGEKVNVVPEDASLWFDIRYDRTDDGPLAISLLNDIAQTTVVPGTKTYGEGQISRPPKSRTPGFDRLLAAHRQTAAALGISLPEPIISGGGTDGSLMQAEGLPVLDSMGVVGSNAHTTEECADLNTLTERAAVSAVLLKRLMFQPGQDRIEEAV